MRKEKFQEFYRKLNPRQKEAVDAIEGPVMVVAGPGTGKTQILTLRIANILLKTDTPPDAVLALTFTDSAAYSMRRRLLEIIGSLAYRVNIHTFHGFANDIIQTYPDRFPSVVGATHIGQIEQVKYFRKIIEETPLNKLKPYGNPFYYLQPLMKAVSQLKREDIGYLDYQKLKDKEEKESELSLIYSLYQETLRKEHLYDYDDMIMEVIKTLRRDKDFLLNLQENFHYILADEYQDTNSSQNEMLRLLASFHQSPNLFVVGDGKQAIYRFQGASLENFRSFERLYAGVKIITLRENYRSCQPILDCAHSLMPENKLTASLKVSKGGVELATFAKKDQEVLFLAEEIKRKIKAGVSPSQIAVLYRDNKEAEPLGVLFERYRLPYIIQSDENILEDQTLGKFILLLRAVHFFGEEEALMRALHIDFLKVESLALYKLSVQGKKAKENLYALMSRNPKFKKLYLKISSWHSASLNKNLLEVLEIVARESGFIRHLFRLPDGFEKLEKLDAFFREIKNFLEKDRAFNLGALFEYLALMEEHKISIGKASSPLDKDGVRLLTAHRSKGLEFDHVYIVGVTDDRWGGRRKINHFRLPFDEEASGEDDERRLFYVALTRARKEVTITFAKEGLTAEPKFASRFIEEIDKKYLR